MGPTSVVLAGVHGDERAGIEAFKKILPTLQIEKGQVFFGYGNPRAIASNARFVETNLNRMFKPDFMLSEEEKTSYEYARAQLIKKYLDQSDALLDIHASRTPNSTPFVICESNAKGIVEYLPISLVVSGFDTVEPGGTDYYMNSLGKIGVCVECGYFGDPESSRVAEKSIFAFLKSRGHIANDTTPQRQSYLRMYEIYITKTSSFTLAKSFNDFEEVLAGQIIGIDGKKEIYTEKDGVILFARNRKEIACEAFLLGEKKNSLA